MQRAQNAANPRRILKEPVTLTGDVKRRKQQYINPGLAKTPVQRLASEVLRFIIHPASVLLLQAAIASYDRSRPQVALIAV